MERGVERIGKLWREAEKDFLRVAMIRPAAIRMSAMNSTYAKTFLLDLNPALMVQYSTVAWEGQEVLTSDLPEDEVDMILRLDPKAKSWYLIKYKIDLADRVHRWSPLSPEGKIIPTPVPKYGIQRVSYLGYEKPTVSTHKPGRYNRLAEKA